jgi:hypothetical protein
MGPVLAKMYFYERHHLEYLNVYGCIIGTEFGVNSLESMKWNCLFQDVDEWQVLVKIIVIKCGVCRRYIWRSWLRHCAARRKVAGSIPSGVIVIFNWFNPSGRTVALGSTQTLTEMSTRNVSWG